VTGVVVGLPLDQEGAEAEAAAAARALAADIAQHSGQRSSCGRAAHDGARTPRRARDGRLDPGPKDDVDALAAALLLQHYLDAKRGSGV